MDRQELEQLDVKELKKLNDRLVQERGKQDLYYLNSSILDHSDLTKRTHGELCDLVTKWRKKNSLILLPRGHFKTAIITEGYVIQELLNDPNQTILVYNETYTKALTYVRAIREHFEGEIVAAYGDVRDPKYWREDGFRLKGRTKKSVQPSVTPSGIDKPTTGMHFDLIICDDLLGETNTNSKEQLEKAKKRFQELFSILNPGGRIVVVGTIWDEDDLYVDIIKSEGFDTDEKVDKLFADKIHEGKYWNIYIRTVEGGKFFPERFGPDVLDVISKGQTDAHHKKQYWNDWRVKTDAVFTKELRDRAKDLYDNLKRDENGNILIVDKYILSDPATSQSSKADYSAFIVLGRTAENIKVVLEPYQDRLDPREYIDTALSLHMKYRERKFSIEAVGFQKVIIQWLKEKAREKRQFIRLVEFNPGNQKSKASRIESLIPWFKNGEIAYSREHYDLDEQLRKFPSLSKADHDDLIDALSQGPQILGQPKGRSRMAAEDTGTKIEPLWRNTCNAQAKYRRNKK